MKTYFASPERSSPKEIVSSYKTMDSEKNIVDTLEALSVFAAILDKNRQIVYANSQFLKLLGAASIEKICGKRPGEALNCIHHKDYIGGCGTSEACSVCGAANSIVKSQSAGEKSEKEARITSMDAGKIVSWDLKVTTAPLIVKDETFYVFTIQDISDEKRKQNLDRIFFHDILNSAGSLNGLLTLLKDEKEGVTAREIIDLSEQASNDLVEEIKSHRQLTAAENGDLIVDYQRISSIEILKSSVAKIAAHEVARGKRIIIDKEAADTYITTDRCLLQRILINMIKNALEATSEGGIVQTGISTSDNIIRFEVRNESFMSYETQLQIFQRSFSTRGTGRGVGTYSIKLLAENYLKGRVGFTSSETDGTIFFIVLLRSTIN